MVFYSQEKEEKMPNLNLNMRTKKSSYSSKSIYKLLLGSNDPSLPSRPPTVPSKINITEKLKSSKSFTKPSYLVPKD